jgi:hypothetical protein
VLADYPLHQHSHSWHGPPGVLVSDERIPGSQKRARESRDHYRVVDITHNADGGVVGNDKDRAAHWGLVAY